MATYTIHVISPFETWLIKMVEKAICDLLTNVGGGKWLSSVAVLTGNRGTLFTAAMATHALGIARFGTGRVMMTFRAPANHLHMGCMIKFDRCIVFCQPFNPDLCRGVSRMYREPSQKHRDSDQQSDRQQRRLFHGNQHSFSFGMRNPADTVRDDNVDRLRLLFTFFMILLMDVAVEHREGNKESHAD